MDKAKPVWRDQMGKIVCHEELCDQKCNAHCPVYLKIKGDEKVLTEQYGRAIFFYLQAISIADDYTEAWEKLSICYEKIGKTTEAAFAHNNAVGRPDNVPMQTGCVTVAKPEKVSDVKDREKCIAFNNLSQKNRDHNDLMKDNMLLLARDIDDLYHDEKYSECVNYCIRFDRMYGAMADSEIKARIDSIRRKCADEVSIYNEEMQIKKSRHRDMAIVMLITFLVVVTIVYFSRIGDSKKIAAVDPVATLTSNPTATVAKPVVTETPRQSIEIRGSKDRVTVGKTIMLEARVAVPLNNSETIQWSSSDSMIARVYNTGMVKGLKIGTVTITAALSDEIKATYQLTIVPKVVEQENGFVIKPIGEADAPVTIHAPKDGSCYVVFIPKVQKISEILDGMKKFSLYVKAGETVKVNVPIGTYEMYYAMGEEWYGREYKFGDGTGYYKADTQFKFYHEGDYVYGTEVTLYKVKNGNMATEEIEESEFPD